MACRLAIVLFSTAFASNARAQHDPVKPVFATFDEAQRQRCPEVGVVVRSASTPEVGIVCEAAKSAIDTLGTCDLHVKGDIVVDVTDDVYFMSGRTKAGEYLPGTTRVRVMSYAAHFRHAKPGFGQTKLPLSVHYSGVIAHEIAHAVFHQSSQALDLPVTAHEYVAYAAQLKSYPAEVRAALQGHGESVTTSNLFVFSHFLLLADPNRFAMIAYNHFQHPGNGCTFLAKVLHRKVFFPPPSD